MASTNLAIDSPQTSNTDPAAAPIRVSIVVPCMNEALVIGEFVDWCMEGLKNANVTGEVLIIDSSTDRSPEIAEARGARVLRVPKRGLGQAYIDALPHIRGQYVIMGDADLTYDFRAIAPFVQKLDEGYEFVIGTRLRGDIEEGAMPKLHRFLGTPVTTFILNMIYGSRYSDIHCGMRAMTLAALKRINLQSSSWEYASEMVLKAAVLRLKTAEIPISFFKDREGRESHHKRSGWLSPWFAAWINLKVMFVFAPDFFLFWPGMLSLVLGLILSIGLVGGPVRVGPVEFNLHWMLLGVAASSVGYGALHLALLAKVFYNFKPDVRARVSRLITYDRGMVLGLVLMFTGVVLGSSLTIQWIVNDLRLEEISHPAVFGILLLILGFQTITHTLILHMVSSQRTRVSPSVTT
jgi:glycosyltransferase involved in cell wall biosynthesis